MITTAIDVVNLAIASYKPIKVYSLFSGGHDSLTASYIASQASQFDGCVHINTGIGIEETREFVRATCAERHWPLIEMHPDKLTYDELVLNKGFPSGPQSHKTMYYWLKQRQVRRLVKQSKQTYFDRVLLVTGIRVEESKRRMLAKLSVRYRKDGCAIWVNPILDWTAVDCSRLIEQVGLVRNPVVDALHKSGECLCGAFANANDIEEIRMWYPKTAERIAELEQKAKAAGVPCLWAGAPGQIVGRKAGRPKGTFKRPLCIGCE